MSQTNHTKLSAAEQAQLGTPRLKRSGQPSSQPWPSAEQWPAMREMLVARSAKSNPNLDPELTAYTPGETLALLDHPEISGWHEKQAKTTVPAGRTIVLVPCAKTKPWTGPGVGRSRLYSAYHQLLAERDDLYFVTISEPLGIVAQDDWASFPQYDNPGLFADAAQRSGMHLSHWKAEGYESAFALPYDEAARAEALERLGAVIGEFLARHSEHRIVSFVDEAGCETTHGIMVDHAISISGANVERHVKRAAPRVSPLDHMRERLSTMTAAA